jgi:hypothetical protein
MGGATAAIPALMAAAGPALSSAGVGAGAAQGVSSAMPGATELFGALGQAIPKSQVVSEGGPGFGMGANGGPEDISTIGEGFGGLFGGGEGGPNQVGGLNSNDYEKKGGPTPPPPPGSYPGQEAMSQYKDMSNYSSMGELSGLMNSQPGQKQNRMVTEKPVMNQYLQSLMGG